MLIYFQLQNYLYELELKDLRKNIVWSTKGAKLQAMSGYQNIKYMMYNKKCAQNKY